MESFAPDDLTMGAFFGGSVDQDGDVVVVGARSEENIAAVRTGAAYVYYRTDEGLRLIKRLEPPAGADGDAFGSAVAVDGNRIVVGAPNDAQSGPNAGRIYLFIRDRDGADNWGLVDEVGGGAGDWAGWSVDIEGDLVAWGAHQDDGAGTKRGLVAIGQIIADQGIAAVAPVLPDDPSDEAVFGISVDLHGDLLAVGAAGADDNGPASGAAYVFGRDVGGPFNWGQIARVVPDDGAAEDLFGLQVAVDEDTLVVTSPRRDGAGVDRGGAYVFEHDGGGWTQAAMLAPDTENDESQLGWGLALDGRFVAVGASISPNAQPLHLFERDASGWSLNATLTAPDSADNNGFGYAVTLNDRDLLVGAPADGDLVPYGGIAYLVDLNFVPVPQADEVETDEDTPAFFRLQADDANPGDALKFSVAREPQHGTVSVEVTGETVYVPDADFNGDDSFGFQVTDGSAPSEGEVAIVVNAVNDPPTAFDQTVHTPNDRTLTITLVADDVDDDAWVFERTAEPAHGTISNFDPTTGQLQYQPEPGYLGEDSFTFRSDDGDDFSDDATVTIVVTEAAGGGGEADAGGGGADAGPDEGPSSGTKDEGGCGCASSGGVPDASALLLAVLLVFTRRRASR
jgi:hypothetical protein